jgi:hypothetical protein
MITLEFNRMKFFFTTLCALALTTQLWAHANYTGRSGAPGRNTCASSCHGGGGGTVQISGFPTTYTPGQAYTLTIQRLSGNSIVNFNSSCRVGTGTVNAGVIAAGTGTGTYNVSGETNGVHFTANNQISGTFNWTAPAAGTGTVRLYAGALQTGLDGENTTIVLVANEAAPLPGLATNPNPADLAVNIPITTALAWTAGSNTLTHDVYFGLTNPPALIGNQNNANYDPPGELLPGIVYFWRIDERNAAGFTPGTVWQFTTVPLPGEALNPDPANHAVNVLATVNLNWTPGQFATSHDVYFGTVNPPPFFANQTALGFDPPGDLTAGITYYWQIDERNDFGLAPGEVWEFTVDAPVIPNAPAHLVIQPLSGTLRLTWDSVAGSNEYRIYRDSTPAVQMNGPHMIGTATDTTFTDTSPTDLKFFYVVTAAN